MSTRCKSVFDNSDIAAELADLHSKFVVVLADIASYNIVFVYKTLYIHCLREELCLNTSEGNPTYTCSLLSKVEILSNQKSDLLFFGLSKADEDLDLQK